MRSAARAAVAAAVLGGAVVLVPLVTAGPGHGRTRRAAVLAQVIARLLLRALRVDVQRRGTAAAGPCLVVANHVSWLDALALAAAAPMVPVAQAEVARRPLIGAFATGMGAILLQRNKLRQLPDVVAELTATLRRGHRVLVFPESMADPGPTALAGSTTGSRDALRPFRRAAFQAAVDAAVVISPVALTYHRVAPAPPRGSLTYDDDLLGLLWRCARGGPVTVLVHWLPVIPAVVGTEHPANSRAIAAWRAERAVALALGQPLADRRLGRSTRVDRRPVRTPALKVA
jgi:1-acyl-sn-glycerol-3-phosphate acyltransferase